MDEKGFVKIVGRTKEMIIRGGENIYPKEIEDILHLHSEIFDAYVSISIDKVKHPTNYIINLLILCR